MPEAWTLNGPPALCVLYARLGLFGEPFDLVVSGINPGANVGRSVYHSGTIGACLTARNGGISGVAVSQAVTGWGVEGQGWGDVVKLQKWHVAAEVARLFVAELVADLPAEPVVVNLNVPNCELDEIEGWELTAVGLEPAPLARHAAIVPDRRPRPLRRRRHLRRPDRAAGPHRRRGDRARPRHGQLPHPPRPRPPPRPRRLRSRARSPGRPPRRLIATLGARTVTAAIEATSPSGDHGERLGGRAIERRHLVALDDEHDRGIGAPRCARPGVHGVGLTSGERGELARHEIEDADRQGATARLPV